MRKDMSTYVYVRHAFINKLHHYFVMWYDDEDCCWEIGIAALPSKRKAYRMAMGTWGKFDQVATTSNSKAGVRPAWFIAQLDSVTAQLQYDTGSDWAGTPGGSGWDLRTTAVDEQRHAIYKYMLSKRGWREVYFLHGSLLSWHMFKHLAA